MIRVDPRNLAQSRCVGARMVQLEGEFPSEPRNGDTSSKMHRSRGERRGIATGNKKENEGILTDVKSRNCKGKNERKVLLSKGSLPNT